jgi:hypothetical protein
MTPDAIKLLGLFGGIAGAITLVWRIIDVFRAYLHIEVTVDKMDGRRVKVRTLVENTNTIARKLDGAFLVIGPADEDPEKTAAVIFEHIGEPRKFSTSNEMVSIVTRRIKRNAVVMQDGTGRMIVPLPFYFAENVDIADENLSFEYSIDCERFPIGVHGVRFYIEVSPLLHWRRLHRLVHGLFEVPPVAAASGLYHSSPDEPRSSP